MRIDKRITQRTATIHFSISELAKVFGGDTFESFGRPPAMVSDHEASLYRVENIKEVEDFLRERGVTPEGMTFDTVLAYAKKREIQRNINLSGRKYIFDTLSNYTESEVYYRGYLSTGGEIDVNVRVNVEAELVGGEVILHFFNPHHLVNSWFKRGFCVDEFPVDLWISNEHFKKIFIHCLPKLLLEFDFEKGKEEEIKISIDPQNFYKEFFEGMAKKTVSA